MCGKSDFKIIYLYFFKKNAMRKIFFLIVLIIQGFSTLQAQSKYFERTYLWEYIHDAQKVFLSSDGNYDVFGNTMTVPNYFQNGFLLKVNTSGDTVLLKNFTSEFNRLTIWDVVRTQFGYAIATCMGQFPGDTGCKAGLLLLKHNGDVIYSGYAGTQELIESRARSILQTPDGGYIMAGLILQTSGSLNKLYIVKLKADGETEWEKVYDYFSYHNSFRGILPAPEGGYYAIASIRRWVLTGLGIYQDVGDILLYKLDQWGEVEWQKIYFEGGEGEQSTTFCQASDGSLFIGGGRNFTDLVFKLDTAFNLEWEINEADDKCGPSLVGLTPDGNFLVSGCTDVPPGEADAYIKKITPNGDVLWRRVYGDAGHDYFYTHLILPDGSILLGGRNDMSSSAAVYIVKTNCMGLLTQPAAAFSYEPQGANEVQFTNLSLYAYPDSTDGGYYIWDFGDGSPPYLCGQGYAPCTGNILTHQYPAPGSYTASLTAIVCTDTSVVQAIIDTQGTGGTVGIAPPQPPRAIGASPLASEGGSFEVVVYPNPAQNTLFLANWQQIAAFKLYAISGVAVLGCSPVAGSQIGIAQLPAGLYIAEAQYKNGAIQRQKLLIQR
ncbi:hypothetical protein BVG80_13560 [Sphingobacteriales bacterium TSM_CSM]|nr:hypothetical protein BVG80_13560 [Sphingobacteriales bacterium TSM_CSM]